MLDRKYTILVTGATGLVGHRLVRRYKSLGHHVISLARRTDGKKLGLWEWAPDRGEIRLGDERLDGVIHLAGASIAGGRWTSKRRRLLWSSRVDATRLLCEALATRESGPPARFLSASGVGFYGDRGAQKLDETIGAGAGFLADLAREWEAASVGLRDVGCRVCHLRMGMVLASEGGALRRMAPVFRLGAGSVFGDGSQYMSWVSVEDAVAAYEWTFALDDLSGPINVATPEAPTNRDFAKTLGRVVGRPVWLPFPRWAVSLVFGRMGRELFLASARAEPAALRSHGFKFMNPDLEPYLRRVLTDSED